MNVLISMIATCVFLVLFVTSCLRTLNCLSLRIGSFLIMLWFYLTVRFGFINYIEDFKIPILIELLGYKREFIVHLWKYCYTVFLLAMVVVGLSETHRAISEIKYKHNRIRENEPTI